MIHWLSRFYSVSLRFTYIIFIELLFCCRLISNLKYENGRKDKMGRGEEKWWERREYGEEGEVYPPLLPLFGTYHHQTSYVKYSTHPEICCIDYSMTSFNWAKCYTLFLLINLNCAWFYFSLFLICILYNSFSLKLKQTYR